MADTVGGVAMRSEGPRGASTRALAWLLTFACAPGPVLAAPPEGDAASEAPPIDEGPKTAAEWYGRGIELVTSDDYLGGAEAFLRSYELKPTPEALFNAGLAYETAGRPIEAITTYRRHLAEPKADPEQMASAEASIETLLREVVVIKGLRYDDDRVPMGITIAGEVRELDEFPLLLLPGAIEVEVVDGEGVVGRETYTLEAGEALVLDVRALWPKAEVEPEPEPEPEPEVEPVPFQPDPRQVKQARILRISGWTGVALTGAGLVAIGISGGLWADYHRREDALLCPCPPGGPDRPVWIERMNTAQLANNIAIGVTAVAAVTTLAVGIMAIRATRQTKRGAQVRSATRMRVRLGGLGFEF